MAPPSAADRLTLASICRVFVRGFRAPTLWLDRGLVVVRGLEPAIGKCGSAVPRWIGEALGHVA
jgi:hypothetical protein